MADMTSEARVVALDRPWPGEVASRSGDLLDVVFGWADFTRLRRLVASQCAAAGLTGSRLDDFVLAVHEITANAIMHAGSGGRLILRRDADGLRCVICDRALQGGEDPAAPGCRIPRARDGAGRPGAAGVALAGPGASDTDDPDEPSCAESGRGLWLAARLTDELIITSGPDSTIVSLYVHFE
jgi:serine/threonine-protein kinase RsbW